MVAKIKNGKSLIGALNYNENKVRMDKAQLIDANGYFKDLDDLNFYDKLFRLSDLAARNQRTKTNSVHISLNFAIGEQLESPILQQIIADYMTQIGFGNQPYLAYQHSDAGHPHVHIVTTNIRSSGERIALHLLGKTKSEEARKAIEIKYGLQQAEGKSKEQKLPDRIQLSQVKYGKTETKRAITNVLSEVLKSYKFTSVPELNAVLNQFNVAADRGSKDSRMFEKNGLVYWVLDEKGNKLGVPIKASSIYGKPTIKTLEDRFRLNELLRKPSREPLKKVIDDVLAIPVTKAQFQQALHQKGIETIFRQNEEGRLYGVTFVDNRSRSVFNGNDLGKSYSAVMLVDQFLKAEFVRVYNNSSHKPSKKNSAVLTAIQTNPDRHTNQNDSNFLLYNLFKEEQQDRGAIGWLQQRKRKKKRKGHSLN
jgi:hypothetical protein